MIGLGSGPAAGLSLAGFVLAVTIAATAPPAAAEIFKCVDQAGNVTYQNEKCPTGTKAGKVEIFDNNWTASRSEKDAEWQRNAAQHRVVTGMPARWVREALGDPAETRETTTGGATDLWLYNLPDRSVQVGMLDNQAVWVRETPVVAPAARIAPSPGTAAAAPSTPPPIAAAPAPSTSPSTAAPAPRAIDILRAPEALRSPEAPRPSETARDGDATTLPRAAESRRMAEAPSAVDAPRRITRGRDCREVIAELGPPDRQREIPPSDASGTDAMIEYLYEPSGSTNAARTRILCANGKVEGVDRSVAR
jgi:hypothetical protein